MLIELWLLEQVRAGLPDARRILISGGRPAIDDVVVEADSQAQVLADFNRVSSRRVVGAGLVPALSIHRACPYQPILNAPLP